MLLPKLLGEELVPTSIKKEKKIKKEINSNITSPQKSYPSNRLQKKGYKNPGILEWNLQVKKWSIDLKQVLWGRKFFLQLKLSCNLLSYHLPFFDSKKKIDCFIQISNQRNSSYLPPYFAEGDKIFGVFLYKRPYFSIGKKANGVIAPPPYFFEKWPKGGRQLTRIALINICLL